MREIGCRLFGEEWSEVLSKLLCSLYFQKLGKFVAEQQKNGCIPSKKSNLLFNCFRVTPYSKVKIVILGQDPYSTPGAFDGLAFSNSTLINPQPSLRNILTEVEDDIYDGFCLEKDNYSLYRWAEQGVLLINTAHTVMPYEPNRRDHIEAWKEFTDYIIKELCEKNDLIWMLWGNSARNHKYNIKNPSHLILESVHPSPLSASKGFFGCKHFSKANEQLSLLNKKEIIW
jgi:uracil-DNA glycosylase